MAAEKQRIAWHPGFASAIQLELAAYKECLEFETEHELNRQPLRIDVVVVKKDPDVHVDIDIAAAFKGHNLLEFKSEEDSLNIDDLFKTLAYGCLYKAYGASVDAIHEDDITLTLIRRTVPKQLLKRLESKGCTIENCSPGVYLVNNLLFTTQILATGELNDKDHIWLASLASDLEQPQVKNLVIAAGVLSDKDERILADSVLDVVTLANSDAVERLKKSGDDMAKTLYEIMKPEIDEAIEQARREAMAEGTILGVEKGMERGMEKGMEKGRELGVSETIRSVVERLLARGGFSVEDIADISGATLEEVRAAAAAMPMALA